VNGRVRHVDFYVVGAICLALCTFAVTPIVLAALASLKTPAEAAAEPPT
jgi:multiple sugar transport system permease protein